MKLHSKKDVARSQLEEAIKLFFDKRDPVSIHTLIGASHQIMRGVANNENIEYRCIIEEIPQREKIASKEWYKAAFIPRNFFKHADNDANMVLDFDPNENEIWLLDSCILFGQVFNSPSKAVEAFWSWYQIKNPELKACFNTPKLVQLAEVLNTSADDFEFFRDQCDESA